MTGEECLVKQKRMLAKHGKLTLDQLFERQVNARIAELDHLIRMGWGTARPGTIPWDWRETRGPDFKSPEARGLRRWEYVPRLELRKRMPAGSARRWESPENLSWAVLRKQA